MLMVASHNSVPPYCAVTAGPKSHSPAPMAEPANNTPGPRIDRHDSSPRPGGGTSSSSCQSGIRPADTVATGSVDRDGSTAVVIVARLGRHRWRGAGPRAARLRDSPNEQV